MGNTRELNAYKHTQEKGLGRKGDGRKRGLGGREKQCTQGEVISLTAKVKHSNHIGCLRVTKTLSRSFLVLSFMLA